MDTQPRTDRAHYRDRLDRVPEEDTMTDTSHRRTNRHQTELRAQMEPMTIEYLGPDLAEVTNLSHGDDADARWRHTYMIEINPETTDPVACSCPDHRYTSNYCKHMAATKRDLLINGTDPIELNGDASAEPVADGGLRLDDFSQPDDTCQHGQPGCCGPEGDDLPCFDCFVIRQRNDPEGEGDDNDEDYDDADPAVRTDGGVVTDDTPSCESCGHETVENPRNTGSPRVCTFCGCYLDADGTLPREEERRCPNCAGAVAYGPLEDARTGLRGFLCVGECDRLVSPEDKPPVQSAPEEAN